MTQLFASREFSSDTARPTKTLILATLAVLLVGCGGGGGGGEPASQTQSTGPGLFDQGGLLCELGAALLGGDCADTGAGAGAGAGNVDPCNDIRFPCGFYDTATQPSPPLLDWPEDPVLRTVTLDWTPRAFNMDGTVLTDLDGYIVYFGPESGIYTDFRVLNNPGLVTYVLDLPREGTWYIAITATNVSGVESLHSNEVMIEAI